MLLELVDFLFLHTNLEHCLTILIDSIAIIRQVCGHVYANKTIQI